MYQSHVIAGRVMEIRGDQVIVQQGDTVCSYHLRYYMLVNEESFEAEPVMETVQHYSEPDSSTAVLPYRKRWKPWIELARSSFAKKNAHRI
ncbi:hypothetical protein Q5741_09625 [Paenibacillus sp. JX-17]|uniref:Uncharacterized protein n=1 Tax=Paenibacillus lacisoli TaxID=3064525 RepID=A0ABT9CBN8_9BACL|nr:hypothetical protein [Paenibacillus sp. JX-17]MDO7906680.1 hypothetical protein [Paenibacillus sp. JX-17]